ncbi:Endonuclease/exonuclease/phosphatase [Spinellus fusiger]|nr:Endonuclease/exonuclease/phosphatase [Spinellus fusiger]
MSTPKSIRCMTFNVRHDHGPNSTLEAFATPPEINKDTSLDAEQPWSVRKWKIADTVLLYSPDIEPDHHQVVDLVSLLSDDYEWIGAGREDGKQAGEYCAVFYKRESVSVEDWKVFWLSETPDVPGSKSWDASHPRIATQVEFKRGDGSLFTLINTHFDHRGLRAREEAAKLLLQHIKGIESVVIVLGDFNSPEDDPAYITLTHAHNQQRKDFNTTFRHLVELNKKIASNSKTAGLPIRTSDNGMTLPTHHVFRKGEFLQHLKSQEEQQAQADNGQEEEQQQQLPVLLDTRYELVTRLTEEQARASLSGPFGYAETFTSFGVGQDAETAPLRLDYIFVMKNSVSVKVKSFAVLPNQYDDGLYISDHRPVLATLVW